MALDPRRRNASMTRHGRYFRMAEMLQRSVLASVLIILASITGITNPASAMPSISVSGQERSLRVEAKDAALSDILSYLAGRYGFTFQSHVPLGRTISGRWEGPLRTIIDRLLDRHDYIARSSSGQLVITVYRADAGATNSDMPMPRLSPTPLPGASAAVRSATPSRVPAAVDNGFMK